MTGLVWCSRSSQFAGGVFLPGTAAVITGPDCPEHKAPMHRAPAMPGTRVTWICHGYDGEGCGLATEERLATS